MLITKLHLEIFVASMFAMIFQFEKQSLFRAIDES